MDEKQVAALQPGEVIVAFFLVREKALSLTRTGNPYLSLDLQDRSGRIDAKVWDSAQAVNDLFGKGPACARLVIDISADGYNSVGKKPVTVYEALDFSATTVNALVIGGQKRPKLKEYFEAEVIQGPDAFLMTTESFADYAKAFRHKLLREVQGPSVVATVVSD